MGSVLSHYKCKCGGVITEESYYKIHSSHRFCSKCGTTTTREYDFNTESYIEDRVGGYGSFLILTKNGVKSGGFDSKESAMTFFKQFKNNPPKDVVLSKSYIHFYDEFKKIGKVVWGNGKPSEYEDLLIHNEDEDFDSEFDALIG